MRIDIITLVSAVFDSIFDESVLGAAKRSGIIQIELHDLRPYGTGRHRMVDDTPYGGGPGMVLKPEPLANCISDLRSRGEPAPVIGLTPQGVPLTTSTAKHLAGFSRIILVCGRYEGFDERILSEFDLQLSTGDYVLTGGDVPAMTVVDAISRMLPGTVGCADSVEQDSFYNDLLDHPQYTRPALFKGRGVPLPLVQGNHSTIEAWRKSRSILNTVINRADLLWDAQLSITDLESFQAFLSEGSDEPHNPGEAVKTS